MFVAKTSVLLVEIAKNAATRRDSSTCCHLSRGKLLMTFRTLKKQCPNLFIAQELDALITPMWHAVFFFPLLTSKASYLCFMIMSQSITSGLFCSHH